MGIFKSQDVWSNLTFGIPKANQDSELPALVVKILKTLEKPGEDDEDRPRTSPSGSRKIFPARVTARMLCEEEIANGVLEKEEETHTHEKEYAEVSFGPEDIGIDEITEEGKVIGIIQGGQADGLGVKSSWTIVKLKDSKGQTEPYSKERLHELITAKQGFTATFKKEKILTVDCLSSSEIAKIHLARALVMCPEVLIMQRPLSHHDNEALAQCVLDAIKQHNKNRGVGMPAETIHRRRPRSVFFTPENMDQAREATANGAGVIWQLGDLKK